MRGGSEGRTTDGMGRGACGGSRWCTVVGTSSGARGSRSGSRPKIDELSPGTPGSNIGAGVLDGPGGHRSRDRDPHPRGCSGSTCRSTVVGVCYPGDSEGPVGVFTLGCRSYLYGGVQGGPGSGTRVTECRRVTGGVRSDGQGTDSSGDMVPAVGRRSGVTGLSDHGPNTTGIGAGRRATSGVACRTRGTRDRLSWTSSGATDRGGDSGSLTGRDGPGVGDGVVVREWVRDRGFNVGSGPSHRPAPSSSSTTSSGVSEARVSAPSRTSVSTGGGVSSSTDGGVSSSTGGSGVGPGGGGPGGPTPYGTTWRTVTASGFPRTVPGRHPSCGVGRSGRTGRTWPERSCGPSTSSGGPGEGVRRGRTSTRGSGS